MGGGERPTDLPAPRNRHEFAVALHLLEHRLRDVGVEELAFVEHDFGQRSLLALGGLVEVAFVGVAHQTAELVALLGFPELAGGGDAKRLALIVENVIDNHLTVWVNTLRN